MRIKGIITNCSPLSAKNIFGKEIESNYNIKGRYCEKTILSLATWHENSQSIGNIREELPGSGLPLGLIAGTSAGKRPSSNFIQNENCLGLPINMRG